MLKNYTRMNPFDFGRHLLDTNDLDPIYVALTASKLPKTQLNRWLLAYWCYYDAATACFLSEQEGRDFWRMMNVAAVNETLNPVGDRWRRGHERRHFRGAQATASVLDLYHQCDGQIDALIDNLYKVEGESEPIAVDHIMERVQRWRGFGPWISFKVADMIDRVLDVRVEFDNGSAFLFDTPLKAVDIIWADAGGDPAADMTFKINAVVNRLLKEFGEYLAPPFLDRPVNVQEIETILCKYKSHLSGHYPRQNDTIEIRLALQPWLKVCDTANAFLSNMPEVERAGQ